MEQDKTTKTKAPQKSRYEVVVQAVMPVTAKYRVWAFSPEEAAEMVKTGKLSPESMQKPAIIVKNIKSLVVYIAGTMRKVFSFSR